MPCLAAAPSLQDARFALEWRRHQRLESVDSEAASLKKLVSGGELDLSHQSRVHLRDLELHARGLDLVDLVDGRLTDLVASTIWRWEAADAADLVASSRLPRCRLLEMDQ